MHKASIVGHFAEGKLLLNGQVIKTKVLACELRRIFGSGAIHTIDTHDWKRDPFLLVFRILSAMKNSENIIILPARNGIKVFLPLVAVLNRIFHRKLHYVVIGGWLPEFLDENSRLKKRISRFDGVYVETHSMVRSLTESGFHNIAYLPNFKQLELLDGKDLVYPTSGPYKLCTFSRVMKEKGIEDAIEAVTAINNQQGRTVYSLDIYGPVEEGYRERFEEIRKDFPDFVKYRGLVDYSESTSVLKNYFLLLFPTCYDGEGFAGTILDAFASGVPVIATDWRYNSEIIHDQSDGLLYDWQDKGELENILNRVKDKPEIVNSMKKNCLLRAESYLPDVVIRDFAAHL